MKLKLYKEYCVNSELQEYVKSIAKSLDLTIFSIEKDGVYISPKNLSSFAPRLSDISVLGKEKNKGIFALIMVAIAAYFFPGPQSFQQKGVITHGLDETRLHDYIIEKIEQLKAMKGNSILDSELDQHDIDRLLVAYYKMNKVSDTNPQSTTTYFIKKTFEYLKYLRLLTIDNGKYIPTNRFRIQMEEFSNNEYYLQYIENRIADKNQNKDNT